MIKCLMPDYFKCDNIKCIPISFVCDKEKDCADGSDESHCHDVCILIFYVNRNADFIFQPSNFYNSKNVFSCRLYFCRNLCWRRVRKKNSNVQTVLAFRCRGIATEWMTAMTIAMRIWKNVENKYLWWSFFFFLFFNLFTIPLKWLNFIDFLIFALPF